MSEEKIEEQSLVLNDGEVFAVKSGEVYFHSLVNDYPLASRTPVYFTREDAEKCARWCKGGVLVAKV